MRVFISIPWFLPAYKAGGPIQSIANLVNNFNGSIEYFIFCGDKDLNHEPLQNIDKGEWVSFNNYTKVWYAPKKNLSKSLLSQINTLKPDVVYIIGLFNWQFNIMPMIFCKAEKKILSIRGMLHPGALTQKKWKKRIFLQGLKLFGITGKMIFHATDQAEELFIKKEFGLPAKIRIAGNFSKTIVKKDPLQKAEGSLKLVTIALISPMKNHLEVLKALMHCHGNISYNIYGPIKEEPYWQLCKIQIGFLPPNIEVIYHGEIKPTLVENILSSHHIFIMPSKSENFGHALIEALAAGKPVITSHSTPWNELEKHRAGMNVTPNEQEISKAINHYVSLNNENYKIATLAAGHYAALNSNISQKISEYRNLFFN